MDSDQTQSLGGSGRRQALLDIIDSLRDYNLDRYVELPQIIVVGDQSSGKSSVLESISMAKFPSKSDLCTRFATELVLRRKIGEQSCRVRIKTLPEDSEETRQKINDFNQVNFEASELPEIIQKATQCMGVQDGKHSFSRHTLHIQISGPNVHQLTLIDLPGFYHSRDTVQSAAGKDLVNKIVGEYMSKKNTIILAVVSAKSHPVMQKVLEEIKVHDPEGQRCVGIITKPDKLDPGSGDEAAFLQLLKNQKTSSHYLKHGWHVLRNRGEAEPDDFDSRDQLERELFQTEPWDRIDDKRKGIESLRTKLSDILEKHISQGFGELRQKIQTLKTDAERRSRDLGGERVTDIQRMSFLEKIARNYTQLADQAVEGRYADEFFSQKTDGVAAKYNLRAQVRYFNQVFAGVMFFRGATLSIQWHAHNDEEAWKRAPQPSSVPPSDVTEYRALEPVLISQEEIQLQIRAQLEDNRDISLPGGTSNKAAMDLFKNLTSKWEDIGRRHIKIVLERAESFVYAAFSHLLRDDDETRNRLERYCIQRFFQDRQEQLLQKLEEILPKHGKNVFPLAMEDIFQQNLVNRELHRAQRLWNSVQEKPEFLQALSADNISPGNTALVKSLFDEETCSVDKWQLERILYSTVELYDVSLLL